MRSWKTTAAGIAALALIIAESFYPEYSAIIAKLIAAATAAGLLAARDNGVTSEQAGASNIKRLP